MFGTETLTRGILTNASGPGAVWGWRAARPATPNRHARLAVPVGPAPVPPEAVCTPAPRQQVGPVGVDARRELRVEQQLAASLNSEM